MTDAKLTLYYLPVRALGESVRMLLYQNGIEFTDTVVQWPEHKERKHEWPFGQLPVLEIDGDVKIGQTGAILHYIDKVARAGCFGQDDIQAALADAVLDSAREQSIIQINVPINIGKNEDIVAVVPKYRAALPTYMDNWTRALGKLDFFHGDAPGYADFYLWCQLNLGLEVFPESFEKHEKMQAWYDRVQLDPAVRRRIGERPPLRDISEALKMLKNM